MLLDFPVLIVTNGEGNGTPTPVLLPGKSHGRRSLVGCSPWSRSLRVEHDLSDFTFTFHFHALEKEMATHSSVLAWRLPGIAEPGGLPSMGSQKVGHDWSKLIAAVVTKSCPTLLQPHGVYIAHEAPLSMRFSRQNYWRRLPFPSSGDFPHPGIEPTCPALTGGFFTTEPPGKPNKQN